MRIYLSGAISNDPNNKEKFYGADFDLVSQGHEVVNPIVITHAVYDWLECMKIDIKSMLDCDCVLVLDKKNIFGKYKIKSVGRDLEIHIAKKLGIPIKYISEIAIQIKI